MSIRTARYTIEPLGDQQELVIYQKGREIERLLFPDFKSAIDYAKRRRLEINHAEYEYARDHPKKARKE